MAATIIATTTAQTNTMIPTINGSLSIGLAGFGGGAGGAGVKVVKVVKVPTGVPHLWQKCASSSSLVPHLWQ